MSDHYLVEENRGEGKFEIEFPNAIDGYSTLSVDEIARTVFAFTQLPNLQDSVSPSRFELLTQEVIRRIRIDQTFLPAQIQRFQRQAQDFFKESTKPLNALTLPRVSMTRAEYGKIQQALDLEHANSNLVRPIEGNISSGKLLVGEPSKFVEALGLLGVSKGYLESVVIPIMDHEQWHLDYARRFAQRYGFPIFSEMLVSLFRFPNLQFGISHTVPTRNGPISTTAFVVNAPTTEIPSESYWLFKYMTAIGPIERTNGAGTSSDKKEAKRYQKIMREGVNGEVIHKDEFHHFASLKQ